ncbi:hypothetical protein DENSPDRAFT_159925 [Dentipellis sp. KUC8613]|nr:hypothetical protein DENSPDRAFT_159925 [Dentipellis sp. KUC8613]
MNAHLDRGCNLPDLVEVAAEVELRSYVQKPASDCGLSGYANGLGRSARANGREIDEEELSSSKWSLRRRYTYVRQTIDKRCIREHTESPVDVGVNNSSSWLVPEKRTPSSNPRVVLQDTNHWLKNKNQRWREHGYMMMLLPAFTTPLEQMRACTLHRPREQVSSACERS